MRIQELWVERPGVEDEADWWPAEMSQGAEKDKDAGHGLWMLLKGNQITCTSGNVGAKQPPQSSAASRPGSSHNLQLTWGLTWWKEAYYGEHGVLEKCTSAPVPLLLYMIAANLLGSQLCLRVPERLWIPDPSVLTHDCWTSDWTVCSIFQSNTIQSTISSTLSGARLWRPRALQAFC